MHGMVGQPIADLGLVDVARLWIIDSERLIRSVPIRFIHQFLMEGEDIIRETQKKFSDVFPFPFASEKFLP